MGKAVLMEQHRTLSWDLRGVLVGEEFIFNRRSGPGLGARGQISRIRRDRAVDLGLTDEVTEESGGLLSDREKLVLDDLLRAEHGLGQHWRPGAIHLRFFRPI